MNRTARSIVEQECPRVIEQMSPTETQLDFPPPGFALADGRQRKAEE